MFSDGVLRMLECRAQLRYWKMLDDSTFGSWARPRAVGQSLFSCRSDAQSRRMKRWPFTLVPMFMQHKAAWRQPTISSQVVLHFVRVADRPRQILQAVNSPARSSTQSEYVSRSSHSGDSKAESMMAEV